MKLVDTQNAKTSRSGKFWREPARLVKSMIYKADDRFVMVCVKATINLRAKNSRSHRCKSHLASGRSPRNNRHHCWFCRPLASKGTIVADLSSWIQERPAADFQKQTLCWRFAWKRLEAYGHADIKKQKMATRIQNVV